MMQKIQNIARRPVTVTGNSGQTWHLAPGVSVEVADIEVKECAKVKKLVDARLIALKGSEPEEKNALRGAASSSDSSEEDKEKSKKSKPTK